MDFRNDPRRLISQLDAAWEVYLNEFSKQIQECVASVVSWTWATDAMFRTHPLFGHADTTPQAEPWRPFTRNWITDEDPKANLEDGWKHGLDEQGRIVLANGQWYGYAMLWRNDSCDRLTIHNSKDQPSGYQLQAPMQDRAEFSRYWHDSDGRIECACRYFRERETHYRKFEWFEYEEKRCTQSIAQSFVIMPAIPHWQRDKSDAELRLSYRPLDGEALVNNLVESMIWRERVKYSYAPAGDLIKAEGFKADGEPVEELLFEKIPDRPFEETVEELAAKTSQAILKVVKKRSPQKPFSSLALIYSAEHAHCGLPHSVRILGHDTPRPTDRFNFEEYPLELEVAFKRPVLKLLTEFNQRCRSLFSIEGFDDEVVTVVSVMRRIAEFIQHQLASTKHISDDFSIVVIDDHGDIDGFELSK